MKAIDIHIRIDDENKRIGTIITHEGYEKESLEKITDTIAALENLKMQFLDKLQSRSAKINPEQ